MRWRNMIEWVYWLLFGVLAAGSAAFHRLAARRNRRQLRDRSHPSNRKEN